MDRRLIDTGAIPLDIDIAQAQQFAMVSDGFLAEAAFGSSPWCMGLACAPTSPASLSVNVGRGAVAGMSVVDSSNPGTAAITNTTDALMKVGINTTSTMLTFTAPASAGQSQVFLIQAQAQETDGGATVLQYFNASNPAQPFAGPGNTGVSQNTVRTQRAVLQVVAGSPAATGSQTAPGATAGWVPLWLVTLANGATTILSANVAQHPSAPFFVPLTQLGGRLLGYSVFAVAGTYGFTTGPFTRSVKVRAVGGGGPGASSTGTTSAGNYSGSGGGGGALAMGLYTVTPNTTYAVVIGAGGTPNNGGGASSFGAFCSAGGGGYGYFVSTGVSPGAVGGTATGGSILNQAGAYGSDGQNSAFTGFGNGADGPLGGGAGRAGSNGGLSGVAGTGGGGGGCYYPPGAGGNGGNGRVEIEELS